VDGRFIGGGDIRLVVGDLRSGRICHLCYVARTNPPALRTQALEQLLNIMRLLTKNYRPPPLMGPDLPCVKRVRSPKPK
jgi:hypothetical protein